MNPMVLLSTTDTLRKLIETMKLGFWPRRRDFVHQEVSQK